MVRHRRSMGIAAMALSLLLLVSCALGPVDSLEIIGDVANASYTYTEDNVVPNTDKAPQDMKLVAAVDGMELYLDETTTRFAFRDANGTLWYSGASEEEVDADEIAYGEFLRAMTSLLTVRVCDATGETTKDYASDRYSVQDGSYTVKYVKDSAGSQMGFRVDFRFEDLSLTIPMVVSIQRGGLVAEVLTKEIVSESDDTVIMDIGVLPHFGSTTVGAEGYLMVPDGSGAIIEMNNGKTAAGRFITQIYGADAAFAKDRHTGNEEKALLPVFGLKNGNGAFLAVISGCDAYANIVAEVAGINTNRNYVFSRYQFRELESFPLKDLGGKDQNYMVVDNEDHPLPDIRVEYKFLHGDKANYNGMAAAYGDYLKATYSLTERKGSAPYALELYGAVRKSRSVLGIPSTVTEVLTSFDQAEAMLEKLGENGLAAPIVRYRYTTKSGIKNKVSDRLDVLGVLGGASGYADFAAYVQEKGGQAYLSLDTTGTKESFFSSGYVRNMMNLKAYQYDFDPLTGYPEKSSKYCLYMPDIVWDKTGSLVENAVFKKDIANLALENLGYKLYTSFGENHATREDTKRYWQSALATAKEQGAQLMLDSAGAYALPYTAVSVDVPTKSNHYSMADYEIPFYQMAVSRFVTCVSQSINLTSNPRLQFLYCVQTGTVPQFSLVGTDPAVLQGTDLEYLFAADYDKWVADVQAYAGEWSALRKVTADSVVTGYRVVGTDVSETTYANGAKVLVNLGQAEAKVDGKTVPAMGYLILE